MSTRPSPHPGLQIQADPEGELQVVRGPDREQEGPSPLPADLVHAVTSPPDEGGHEGDLLGG